MTQGLTLRTKPWGQLAPKFSDLVASKNISVVSVKRSVPVKNIWSHQRPQGPPAAHSSINKLPRNSTFKIGMPHNQILCLETVANLEPKLITWAGW